MKHIFFSLFSFFFINLNFSQCLSGDCINGVGMYDHGSATYEGSFVNGIKNGYGKLINNFDGELWVEGEWIDGIYYGDGRILKDGSIYAGYLEDDILRLNNSDYESLLIIKNLNIFDDVSTNLYSIIEVINATTSDEVLKVALLKLNSLLFEDPDYTVDYINDDILQFAADINKEKAQEFLEYYAQFGHMGSNDEKFKIYTCAYVLCHLSIDIPMDNYSFEDIILEIYTKEEYPLDIIYEFMDFKVNFTILPTDLFEKNNNEESLEDYNDYEFGQEGALDDPYGEEISSEEPFDDEYAQEGALNDIVEEEEAYESEDIVIETYRYKNETNTKCKWCTKDIVCRKKTESELTSEEALSKGKFVQLLLLFGTLMGDLNKNPEIKVEYQNGVKKYKYPIFIYDCPDFCSSTCERLAESRK